MTPLQTRRRGEVWHLPASALPQLAQLITADSKKKYSRFSLDLEQSLRMSSDGGMDHTREALGGCCPAALHYDRKVRANVSAYDAEIQLVLGGKYVFIFANRRSRPFHPLKYSTHHKDKKPT